MAEKNKLKWINNTGNTAIKASVTIKVGKDEQVVEKVFGCYRVNSQSGVIEHNGITEIEADILDAFLEKKIFKDLVDKQTLIILEDVPEEAITPATRIRNLSQQVLNLKNDVNVLTAENEELKKALAKAKKGSGKPAATGDQAAGDAAGDQTGAADNQ